jgi:hypothetical protein
MVESLRIGMLALNFKLGSLQKNQNQADLSLTIQLVRRRIKGRSTGAGSRSTERVEIYRRSTEDPQKKPHRKG